MKRSQVIFLLVFVAVGSSLLTLWLNEGVNNGSFVFNAGRSDAISASTAAVPSADEMEKLLDIYRLIQGKYLEPVEGDSLIEGAIQGMVESLGDPHTTYMEPDEASQFQSSLESSFEGIGAQVIMQNNRVTILSPIKGSPAEKAGLRVNDQILSVNGESLEGLDLMEAVSKIRGPKGSKAELIIARPGIEEPLKVAVVRDEIPLETVYAMKMGAFGVIEISQFSLDTARRFEEELQRLQSENIQGLVIDVRGNPGGLLDSVLGIVDGLIPAGSTIVQVENRDGHRDVTVSKEEPLDVPIVVLADEGSASASEILAAALQQSGGFPVVGTATYGKGTVQNTEPLQDGSQLKLTVAKWLTPKGDWIDGKGVAPDHEVLAPEYFAAVPVSAPEPLLREMNSLEVKNLQIVLEGVGYPAGRTDGYFDASTERAIKAFQRAKGLDGTGVVDEQTASKLNEVLLQRIQDPQRDVQLKAALYLLEKSLAGDGVKESGSAN